MNVLPADDHSFVRQGPKQIFAAERDMKECASDAATGELISIGAAVASGSYVSAITTTRTIQ